MTKHVLIDVQSASPLQDERPPLFSGRSLPLPAWVDNLVEFLNSSHELSELSDEQRKAREEFEKKRGVKEKPKPVSTRKKRETNVNRVTTSQWVYYSAEERLTNARLAATAQAKTGVRVVEMNREQAALYVAQKGSGILVWTDKKGDYSALNFRESTPETLYVCQPKQRPRPVSTEAMQILAGRSYQELARLREASRLYKDERTRFGWDHKVRGLTVAERLQQTGYDSTVANVLPEDENLVWAICQRLAPKGENK